MTRAKTQKTRARRPRARPRRSQEERREETQGRVLAATIECLAELGYSKTSTTRIARRAGVSRGALLHHYSSKTDLLTRAVEYIFELRIREFRQAFDDLPEGTDPASGAIDILWEIFSGPTFDAWLELVVASRSDPELRRDIRSVAERFSDAVERTYAELFPAPDAPNPAHALAPSFAFAFLQGLALERLTEPDEPKLAERIESLKRLQFLFLGGTERTVPHDE